MNHALLIHYQIRWVKWIALCDIPSTVRKLTGNFGLGFGYKVPVGLCWGGVASDPTENGEVLICSLGSELIDSPAQGQFREINGSPDPAGLKARNDRVE